jgi:hypothetical protein
VQILGGAPKQGLPVLAGKPMVGPFKKEKFATCCPVAPSKAVMAAFGSNVAPEELQSR